MKKTICLIVATTMTTSFGASIAVNFGSGRPNATLSGTDTAGVISQVNWNNAATAGGTIADAVDAGNSPSGATVTWSADEEWSVAESNPGAPIDGDATLLNGFISANANQATIDVTAIPYANYDLYLYLNHDRATEDVRISEANNAFGAFVGIENDTSLTSAVTYTQQTSSLVGSGNYVLFSGLTQSDLNIRLDAADDALFPTTERRGAITGIQIVEVIPVPEPSTSLLVLIAGLFSIVRRR